MSDVQAAEALRPVVVIVVAAIVIALRHRKVQGEEKNKALHFRAQIYLPTYLAYLEVVGQALVILPVDDGRSITDQVMEGEEGVIPLGRTVPRGERAHRGRY